MEGAAVDPRWSPGLQSPHAQGELAQPRRESVGGCITGPSAGVVDEADVHAPGEERAHGQHHRRGFEPDARDREHTVHPAALHDEVGHLLLEEREVRLILEQGADGLLVELPVGLGAGRAHRRALAGIERAELDAGAVSRPGHGAAQRVDLAHQVSLADAADGRIATHLAQGLDALSQQQRARSHACGGEGRLGAGMTAADDDDVVGEWLLGTHGMHG